MKIQGIVTGSSGKIRRIMVKACKPAVNALRRMTDCVISLMPFFHKRNKWKKPARQFAALFNRTGNAESFLFFTDPHLMHYAGWERQFSRYTRYIHKVYNATPTSFCVCGGDWLGNNDTMDEACYKLGLVDGTMHGLFGEYCPIVGNHDTNYQGKADAAAEKYTGTLPESTIRNIWFRRGEAAYYRYEGVTSAMYILDAGSDWRVEMNDYRWKQVDWLAGMLKSEKKANIIIATHIIYNAVNVFAPMAENVMALAGAYNARATVALNGKTYGFADCTGKVRFALAGHTHEDTVGNLHGIPFVITTQARQYGMPAFDLVLADWDNNTAHFIRVGDGENRTITMA